jgi:hypothetical protein
MDLSIGRKAVDALLGGGVLWLEDLNGRTPESLLEIYGIGRRNVTRILRALAANEVLQGTRPPNAPQQWSRIGIEQLGFGEVAVRAATDKGLVTIGAISNAPEVLLLNGPQLACVLRDIVWDVVPANAGVEWFRRAVRRYPAGRELFSIPREFRDVHVTGLDLNYSDLLSLRCAGLTRLGQLDGLTVPDLYWLNGFSHRKGAAIARAILRLRTVKPPNQLLEPWIEPDGELRLPALPLTVLNAVRQARGLDDELHALVKNRSRRDAAIVLGRWRLLHDPPISFKKAAAEQGVSTQRAREITLFHEFDLAKAGLRLPIAGRIVEILESLGGILHTAELMSAIERAGIHATRAAVRLLPRLSTLRLIDHIQHLPEVDLWIAGGNQDEESEWGFPGGFGIKF